MHCQFFIKIIKNWNFKFDKYIFYANLVFG